MRSARRHTLEIFMNIYPFILYDHQHLSIAKIVFLHIFAKPMCLINLDMFSTKLACLDLLIYFEKFYFINA